MNQNTASATMSFPPNLDYHLHNIHNPARLSDLVHFMVDRISNTLDHSLYDLTEDKVSPTKIRHIQSKSHKLGDLRIEQCTHEVQDAFYQLGNAARQVQTSLDRLIDEAIAEGTIRPGGRPYWVFRTGDGAVLGDSQVRPYRRKRRTEWVKERAKEEEQKRRMALRKYASPLPTHRPIDKKLIKKGMSMTRRPNSSPRTTRSKVTDSNDETGREETTAASREVRTSKRLQEKKAVVKVEGQPTAVEKFVDELEDYTSGSD